MTVSVFAFHPQNRPFDSRSTRMAVGKALAQLQPTAKSPHLQLPKGLADGILREVLLYLRREVILITDS